MCQEHTIFAKYVLIFLNIKWTLKIGNLLKLWNFAQSGHAESHRGPILQIVYVL